MENNKTGLEFLRKLKRRKDANDLKGLKTEFSSTEISFLRKLSPARYDEEPYDLYRWRQKIKKSVDKYIRFIPNQTGLDGKIIPRRKEKK